MSFVELYCILSLIKKFCLEVQGQNWIGINFACLKLSFDVYKAHSKPSGGQQMLT